MLTIAESELKSPATSFEASVRNCESMRKTPHSRESRCSVKCAQIRGITCSYNANGYILQDIRTEAKKERFMCLMAGKYKEMSGSV